MPDQILPLTLPQLVRQALAQPHDAVLVERADTSWVPTSSAQVLERVANLACAIRASGLDAGDRVGLISHNCVDWVICAFAIGFAGCVVVPIYPTQALDHTEYILSHSNAKLLFIDTPQNADRLRSTGKPLPPTIVFAGRNQDSLAAFEAGGAKIRAEHPELPQAYEAVVKPADLAVLIYTSGTTGMPKGVMLSHDNIGFDARSALQYALERIEPGDAVMSVLPFSHIFEHTMVYIYLIAGVRFHICHDPIELLRDLREVQPSAMTCVPRIFDRVIAGVTGQAMKHGGLQAKLVPWALAVGRDYMHAKTLGSGPSPMLSAQFAIARKLVLEKIRTALGLDRLQYFTSGSAALHVDLAMTFLGLGIPIIQGYGLTESSPVITVNRVSANRYGTVGAPIIETEVKIAHDGEILARGRNIMLGYYRDPEATAEALGDGWLHTGDIGELDGDGYLRVTDRKKEVFKTATGKFVSPARVEAAIKLSVFVSQVMVVGDGRPHPAALICPNWDLVRVELGLPKDASFEELAKRDDVREFLTHEAHRQTSELATYEQIRRVVVLPHEFTVESGELSPAMKIKRRVVEQRYADLIDRAYAVDLREHAYV